MRVIEPYVVIETDLSAAAVMLATVERAGRTCYQSSWKSGPGSAPGFAAMIIKRGHESVLEHVSVTARFVVDRGVSHELVRHRLCAFSQESTRFCNYAGDRFGGEVTFIRPPWVDLGHLADPMSLTWAAAMRDAEVTYLQLLELGWKPEQARSVLPNSLKTDIVVTANLREWRHIFRLRTAAPAHPQMRQVMVPLRERLGVAFAPVFSDLPPSAAVSSRAEVCVCVHDEVRLEKVGAP
jgi:thymidylate synthase (FAD)